MQSTRLPLAAMLVAIVVSTANAQPEPTDGESDQAQRERQFAEKLTGAALIGHFTVDGQDDKPHKPDRYEISKTRKIEGDTWEITARVKYGDVDLQVPIQLNVFWAGDTPVISLTDLKIPLMGGSFTSRVLFHGDRYVGTWQHGEVGGHMFGKVVRADAEKPAEEAPADSSVSGRVTLNGQPVEGAVVEFAPAEQKGSSARGETDDKGQFDLKLPPGEYRVQIKSAERPGRIPERYATENTSLRAEVKKGRNQIQLDLKTD